ncbi:MAG: tetratricopeptide repeat protein [bacterium]
MIYYPENRGDGADDWLREVSTTLLVVDVSQDIFCDVNFPPLLVSQLQTHGYPDGHGLPRPLQRKIARDAHYDYFVTGWCERVGDSYRLGIELYKTENSQIVAERTFEGPDLFSLVDQASFQLRKDLEIPTGHLESETDLPIADITTSNLEACKAYVQSLVSTLHHNAWEDAAVTITTALELDPTFTLANFLAFGIYSLAGQPEASVAAIEAAIANVYRVPERTQFTIKAYYYFNVKQDSDKTLAILDMWSQLYPTDVAVYMQQALFYQYRNDLPAAIEALETALGIDPSQHNLLTEIGGLYQELGDFDQATRYYERYIDLFPSNVTAYLDLAELYNDTGNFERMREVLDKAQLLEPGRIEIELSLAELKRKQGDFDNAQLQYENLLARDLAPRERLEVLDGAFDLAKLRGQVTQALTYSELYLDLAPQVHNPLEVVVVEAIFLPMLGDLGRSDEVLDRVAELVSQVPEPLDGLIAVMQAQILIQLNRLDEASMLLDAARAVVDQLKLEIWRPRLRKVEAALAETQGDLAAAGELYQACIEQLPANHEYRCLAGSALRRQGEHDKAEKMLQSALKLHPAHPEINLELALLAREKNRPDQAREYLRKAFVAWAEADDGHLKAAEARALAADLDVTF